MRYKRLGKRETEAFFNRFLKLVRNFSQIHQNLQEKVTERYSFKDFLTFSIGKVLWLITVGNWQEALGQHHCDQSTDTPLGTGCVQVQQVGLLKAPSGDLLLTSFEILGSLPLLSLVTARVPIMCSTKLEKHNPKKRLCHCPSAFNAIQKLFQQEWRFWNSINKKEKVKGSWCKKCKEKRASGIKLNPPDFLYFGAKWALEEFWGNLGQIPPISARQL